MNATTAKMLLGAVLLALAIGGLWLAGRQPAESLASPPPAALPMAMPAPAADAQTQQRQPIDALRSRMTELLAQGAQASPQQMRQALQELRALAPQGMDADYFELLQRVLQHGERARALAEQLQALPADAQVRRQDLLAQLNALSHQVQQDAQALREQAARLQGATP